jgi:hypothetical protein
MTEARKSPVHKLVGRSSLNPESAKWRFCRVFSKVLAHSATTIDIATY